MLTVLDLLALEAL